MASKLHAVDVLSNNDEKLIVIYEDGNFVHPIKLVDVREASMLALNIIDSLDVKQTEWLFQQLANETRYRDSLSFAIKQSKAISKS